MTLYTSLWSFSLAAWVLAMTPGLDTALVLRQLVARGAASARRAALGVAAGCLLWGAVVASGLGVLLATSPLAFAALKWGGAGSLDWQGTRLWWGLWASRGAGRQRPAAMGAASTSELAPAAGSPSVPQRASAFWQGFWTNALNPKVGLFYIAFLPQFLAQGYPPGPYLLALASIHVVCTVLWFGTLIQAAGRLVPWLNGVRVRASLDGLTGLVFVAFGLRLVMAKAGS